MRIDFPSLSPKEEWIDIKLGYFCYQYTQFKKAKTISCCEGILVLAELQCGRQCTDAAKQDLEDLNIAGRPWCCSWSSNTLATWCEELTHWKRPWCWERLKVGGNGTTKDEMVGWHHRLSGHESEQALGDGEGQGSLACCSPWDRKESDVTERLNKDCCGIFPLPWSKSYCDPHCH